MKLSERQGKLWSHTDHKKREFKGAGLSFVCPCTLDCTYVLMVPFKNPIGGGPPVKAGTTWSRTGDTLDTLTLTPEIDASTMGHWKGRVVAGELVSP